METKQHLTSADYSLTVLSVSLDGCLFQGNTVQNSKSGPIVNLIMTYMTISNSNLMDNSGSSLTLLKSGLNFSGDIKFANNHADYGAALRVCEAYRLFLYNLITHISHSQTIQLSLKVVLYTHSISPVLIQFPCVCFNLTYMRMYPLNHLQKH